jgi:hypothetical protein
MTIRIGHLGIIRLSGKDMKALRLKRFEMDLGRCVDCGCEVNDDLPDWHPRKFDLAHVRNKRNYGDTIENTRTKCHGCHMREHSGFPRR